MFLFVTFLIFSAALFGAAFYAFVVPQRAGNQALIGRLRELRARTGPARPRGGADLLQQQEGLNLIGRFFAWLGLQRPLQKLIDQADQDYKAANVLLICLVLAVATYFLCSAIGIPIRLVNLVLALLIGYLPIAYINFMRSRRLGKFEHQLPEAINLFNRSMKAGHNIQSGLATIAEESLDPVRKEFKTLLEELALGSTTETALHNLGERVPLIDLKFFITGLILQRQTGANMVEVLDNLAILIRERLNLNKKLKAGTAQQRFSAAIFCSVPVFMGAIYAFLKPEYFSLLLEDETGNMILTYAIISETIGILILRKLSSPKF
ncbi:MAG: type II secretion system F family protein [Acidobacteriota bacterium]